MIRCGIQITPKENCKYMVQANAGSNPYQDIESLIQLLNAKFQELKDQKKAKKLAMKEYRCPKTNLLLCKGTGEVEVYCRRCESLHGFTEQQICVYSLAHTPPPKRSK